MLGFSGDQWGLLTWCCTLNFGRQICNRALIFSVRLHGHKVLHTICLKIFHREDSSGYIGSSKQPFSVEKSCSSFDTSRSRLLPQYLGNKYKVNISYPSWHFLIHALVENPDTAGAFLTCVHTNLNMCLCASTEGEGLGYLVTCGVSDRQRVDTWEAVPIGDSWSPFL